MCPKDLCSVNTFYNCLSFCKSTTRGNVALSECFPPMISCLTTSCVFSHFPGKLKNGQSITLADGTVVHPDQVLGESELSKYFVGALILYVTCFLCAI